MIHMTYSGWTEFFLQNQQKNLSKNVVFDEFNAYKCYFNAKVLSCFYVNIYLTCWWSIYVFPGLKI